jgi:hypothetical protein
MEDACLKQVSKLAHADICMLITNKHFKTPYWGDYQIYFTILLATSHDQSQDLDFGIKAWYLNFLAAWRKKKPVFDLCRIVLVKTWPLKGDSYGS